MTHACTKFHLPAVREDALRRPQLVEAVRSAALQSRAVMVCAPAGYGKTTLVAQAAQRLKRDGTVLWINLEPEDDDIQRIGRALVAGLQPLAAGWGMSAETLAGLFCDEPRAVRDGLNAIVNGLYADGVGRHTVVLDDFHHLVSEGAVECVEYLLSRLPAHVSFVIASRAAAPSAFARLQGRGLVTTFQLAQLRFTHAEAMTYLESRRQRGTADAGFEELVRKCDGWPVGLALLSAAQARGADGGTRPDIAGQQGTREVFDFLAKEVFEAFRPELQSFLLRCSVLHELSPEGCSAICGELPTTQLLDELRRESCFVNVLDEAVPVLKVHDLFRQFLLYRLSNEPQEWVRGLHAAAARAESSPDRRMQHWCLAQDWERALEELRLHGPDYVLSGEFGTVARLIALLPESIRGADGRVSVVLGAVARRRWNFSEAAHRFLLAAAQFDRAGNSQQALLAKACAIRPLVFLGEIEQASRLTDECEATDLPVPSDLRSILIGARCWLSLLLPGRAGESRHWFSKQLELARSEPLAPVLGHGVWSYLIGLPGAPELFDELAQYIEASSSGPAPHGTLAASAMLRAWSRAWAGKLQEAEQSLNAAVESNRLAGSARSVAMEAAHLRVLIDSAAGRAIQVDAALAAIDELLDETPAMVHLWKSRYRHLSVRAAWILGRPDQFGEAVASLASGSQSRWPSLSGADELARGYLLLQQQRHDEALPCLRAAHDAQGSFVMEPFCGDARVPLAYCLMRLGQADAAWNLVDACIAEFGSQVPGRFLFERKDVVLDLLGMQREESSQQERLARALLLYRKAFTGQAAAAPSAATRFADLTAREVQVLDLLASGASNKRIAAELFLSLHTVKRHVANVMAKLEVLSRGEAAAVYRAQMRVPATAPAQPGAPADWLTPGRPQETPGSAQSAIHHPPAAAIP